MNENRTLRWAGLCGAAVLPPTIVILALNDFPYPDDTLPGQAYWDYMMPHYTAEVGGIIWIYTVASALLFTLLLARAYHLRAGHTTATGIAMSGCMIAFVSNTFMNCTAYMVPTMMARGLPSFGTEADLQLFTYSWNFTQLGNAVSTSLLAIVWGAIFIANRSHPILPRWLGHWGAGLAVVVNVISPVFVLLPTGPWSPSSLFHFLMQGGPTWGWITAAGIYLLLRKAPTAHAESNPTDHTQPHRIEKGSNG